MKYLVKFFVVTLFLTFSTHAIAEQKIVVLDMKYVLKHGDEVAFFPPVTGG